MRLNNFIFCMSFFLYVSCISNDFYIDNEQLIVRGKDAPIRCLEIKNTTSDSLEYYEILNINNTNKRMEISFVNPPDGYVITNWYGYTLSYITLKVGNQYAITNRSVYDASAITKMITVTEDSIPLCSGENAIRCKFNNDLPVATDVPSVAADL